MTQFGFYFDQSRCTGCYACVIACRDWHDIQDTAIELRKVLPLEQGKYPDIHLSYVSLSCCHCEKPACMAACPVKAISKRDSDGIVIVDHVTCLGKDRCKQFCQQACPYDAPQFGSAEDAKMQLCTLCADRLAENKKPVCVDACPMRALDVAPMDELKKKYGDIREAPGFTGSKTTGPAIIFKPRY